MTLDQLAAVAAKAYGLTWPIPHDFAETQKWINVARAMRDKLANPDAAMLNAAGPRWRKENEASFRAIMRSIR